MRFFALTVLVLGLFMSGSAQTLEPQVQAAVDQQAEKLKSFDAETRLDAVNKLRLLQNAAAARVAASALSDRTEIVRAAAAEATAFLADEDAALFLAPLLDQKKEKSEFVRREAAFALGEAHSKTAVPALIQALQTDKNSSVRAAAAIALGEITDERAIEPLSQTLLLPDTKKNRKVVDEFVRRSAAQALGKTRHKKAVPALIIALRDINNTDDIRRESAFALGLIADKSATQVLQENVNAKDYLLAEIAKNSLQRIESAANTTTITN